MVSLLVPGACRRSQNLKKKKKTFKLILFFESRLGIDLKLINVVVRSIRLNCIAKEGNFILWFDVFSNFDVRQIHGCYLQPSLQKFISI